MSDPRGTLAALRDHVIDRRRFLAFTGALAGTAFYAQLRGDAALRRRCAAIRSRSASRRAIRSRRRSLWTRLAPEPLEGGGMPRRDVAVRWEVARDRRFEGRRRGGVAALPELAHSVHVDVHGLEPGREYFYRFTTGGEGSPVGRTRTAPRPGARVRSCGSPSPRARTGRTGSTRRTAACARRTSTSSSTSATTSTSTASRPTATRARRRPAGAAGDCVTLDRYRLRHALYKTDPDLQEAHRRFPWVVTWDDHEVENDYAGSPGVAETSPSSGPPGGRLPGLLRAPAAAPVGRPPPGDLRLYRRLTSATSPSSTCSTRASTAPTSPAATASSRAARRPRPGRDDDRRRAGGVAARRPRRSRPAGT